MANKHLKRIELLEKQIKGLHNFVIQKLQEHRYHEIADACMDLMSLQQDLLNTVEKMVSNKK